MEAVYQETHESGAVIKIYQDENPLDPRTDWDHEGTEMLCWHGRYDQLGDKHSYDQPADLTEELKEQEQETGEAAELLPLYLMDHSGITMRTGSEAFRACDPQRWDWGQVGWIVARPAGIRKIYDIPKDEPITEDHRRRVRELMEAEVETYDHYLTGQVYGYVVESPWGDHYDSCWGYFGDADDKYILDEARAAAAGWGRMLAEAGAAQEQGATA